jgi:hypothetical protein
MNPKYKELYKYLKSNGMTDLDENSFYNKYSNPTKSKEIWSYLKGNGMTDLDQNTFHASYFGVKKKDPTALDSKSGKLTSVSSTNQKSNGEYTFPGQTGVKFKKENNQWYRKDPTAADYIVIKEPARVKNLEKNALQTTSNTKPKGQVGMEQGYLKKGYQKINNKYYDGR